MVRKMNVLSDSRRIFHWVDGHADRGGGHDSAGLDRRQLDHRGNGLSGAGGVVGDPGRDYGLSLYVAVLCAVSFDYFFLLPLHTFALSGVQQWVAMISFLASCVVAGRVAERARRQARQAEQRREDVERLYALSQEMMLYEDAAGLIRDLPRMIDRIFALDGVVLYVRDQDQFYASTSELPMSIQASLAH